MAPSGVRGLSSADPLSPGSIQGLPAAPGLLHRHQAPAEWVVQLSPSPAGLSFLPRLIFITYLWSQSYVWGSCETDDLVRYGHFQSSLGICDTLSCKPAGQKNEPPCAVSHRSPKPGSWASHLSHNKWEEATEHLSG